MFWSLVNSSLMIEITSEIICCGVDALAARPILLYFLISRNGKSLNSSINTHLRQFLSQICINLFEFELVLSPITIIISLREASSAAASWRNLVALHMVSSIVKSWQIERKASLQASKFSRVRVVCATAVTGPDCSSSSNARQPSGLAAAPIGSSVEPRMPFTSG